MNCHKCGGLMVTDHDRESLTGVRCINCGSPGGGGIKPMPVQEEEKGIRSQEPPEDGCTWYAMSKIPKDGGPRKRYYCGDPRVTGSKNCERHQSKRKNIIKSHKKRTETSKRVEVEKKNPPAPATPPPPPATQGNGHPWRHVEIVAAYVRERIGFLQDEIQQLEKAAAVLDVLALPPE